ncbi:hypothetical protein V8C35DRAFT_120684 [Trichoderma chlorosporum]
MRLALPAIPALPCHEVASAPLFKPMRRHTSAFSLSPAPLPRSKTRATGGSLSGSDYHPHSAAAGRGPRSQATTARHRGALRGVSPYCLWECNPVSASRPEWELVRIRAGELVHSGTRIQQYRCRAVVQIPHQDRGYLSSNPHSSSPRRGGICLLAISVARTHARLGVSPPPSLVPCILPLPQELFRGNSQVDPPKGPCFVLDTEGKEAFAR